MPEVPNILAHEFADFFPLMSEEDYGKLRDDIDKHGYDKFFPVIVYSGKILDGRHRYRACRELGVIPPVREFKGDDDGALCFVERANMQRRDLSPEDRVLIHEKIQKRKHGGDNISKFRNKGNSKPDASGLVSESIPETAKKLGVTRNTIDRHRYIHNNGIPELIDLAENKKVTFEVGNYIAHLSCAEQEEVCKLNPSDIITWVKNHKAKVREEKKEADKRAKDKERYELERKIRESATHPQPTKEQTHFEKLMDGQIPQGPPQPSKGNEPPDLNDIAASPDYISAMKTLRNVQYEKDTDKIVEQLTSVVDSLNALLNFIEETRMDD